MPYLFEKDESITVELTQCSEDMEIGSVGRSFVFNLRNTMTVREALDSGIKLIREGEDKYMETSEKSHFACLI
jgi:hypothetical protein